MFAKYLGRTYEGDNGTQRKEHSLMKNNYYTVNLIAFVLLLIGGVTLGFVGVFDFDVIAGIFGLLLGRIIFILIGLAAIWRIIYWFMSKK